MSELSEIERGLVRSMDHGILAAKAAILERRRDLEEAERKLTAAEEAFRTTLGVLSALHRMAGSVRVDAAGTNLIEVGGSQGVRETP